MINDFNLITILVLDDFQEGIPVAWALPNCGDKILHFTGFTGTKRFDNCSLVMSNMAQQYYNARKEVFPTTDTKYLWSAWHVDRAWRNGIKKYVNNTEKQKEVYYHLRVLMMETDIGKFRALLTKCLTFFQTLYPAFGEYFININFIAHISNSGQYAIGLIPL